MLVLHGRRPRSSRALSSMRGGGVWRCGGLVALPVALCGALLVASAGRAPLAAQLMPPAITTASNGTRPLSPAGMAYYLRMKEGQLESMISFRDTHYPIDSMRKVVEATGVEWLVRLQQQEQYQRVRGLQIDPAGHIGVVAGQEAYAEAQVAARLATPGLRLQEKAVTLVKAIEAFASEHHPERLPIAERYLRQLDAWEIRPCYGAFGRGPI
jgi:hypothetical protein